MFYETYDVTWVGYVQMIWTIIENDCALIASCAPSLRPFLIRFLPDATMTPDNNYYVRGPPRKARGFYPPPTTAGIHDYDDTPEPVLPIQTPQEQELASMESRIGSLMQSSRNGSVMSEASQTSYFFDDGRSGTFIASETTASLEEGCAKDWPLPAKSF